MNFYKGIIPVIVAAVAMAFIGCDDTQGGEKIYGERYYQYSYAVQQTTDGGSIIAADTVTASGRFSDMYIIKTDAQGNKNWSKVIGGEGEDIAYDVTLTNDGGYVVAGVTETKGLNDTTNSTWDSGDARMIKLNASGAVVWDRFFGYENIRDAFKSVEATDDGGYIATGYTGKNADGTGGILIVKVDAGGNTQWIKNIGDSAVTDLSESIKQTDDGGYVIGGKGSDGPNTDAFIIKLDATGTMLWKKGYGVVDKDEMLEDLQVTSDGGYIAAGYVTDDWYTGKTRAGWAMKTDANGNVEWQTLVGGAVWDGFASVKQTGDGGYAFAGETRTYGNKSQYENDVLVVKLNSTGAQQWLKTYGDTNNNYASSIDCLSNGGFVVAGNNYSGIVNAMDIYLIKLNSNGDK